MLTNVSNWALIAAGHELTLEACLAMQDACCSFGEGVEKIGPLSEPAAADPTAFLGCCFLQGLHMHLLCTASVLNVIVASGTGTGFQLQSHFLSNQTWPLLDDNHCNQESYTVMLLVALLLVAC